jgi:hypothetical protein
MLKRQRGMPSRTVYALQNHYNRQNRTKIGLFSSHKPNANGPKSKRNVPNLDRQRNLAQCVGNPRLFWQEAVAARYDVDTLALIARPAPAHAGVMTLEALHGGQWTKEELAFNKAITEAREDLDVAIGSAKERCDTDGGRSNPGMDDWIRSSAREYQNLVKAWSGFARTKDKVWAGRVTDQIGQLAGGALGLI